MKALSQTEKAQGLSDQYKFVSTGEYIRPLINRGWKIRRTRNANSAHGFHILHLQNEEFKTLAGDYIEICVLNSHDGSRAFKVVGGLFRLVCENGLCVGEDFEEFRFVHRGKGIEEKLENSYEKLVAKLNDLKFKFRSLELTAYDQEDFGIDVLNITKRLFNTDSKKKSVEVLNVVNLRQLASIRRIEDKETDTFTVMNVIQENITRRVGLIYEVRITDKETGTNYCERRRMAPTENMSLTNDFKVQTAITGHFLAEVA